MTIDKFLKELKDFWEDEHKIEALKVAVKVIHQFFIYIINFLFEIN